ncbi:MAG: asparagine synthetase B [Candidatus Cloacimonetes bacterium]|nr:asparagine synthetase B [Candidatus Cloacimonadota bacterium]MBL7086407.1 asparagine synthetase B [Candidatus Cloacimonadota bacterium]
MPGILGLISEKNENKLFNQMIEIVNHYDYKIMKFQKNGIHLGKIHLNYVNNSPKPIFSKDKRFAIVMIGEIFSYENIETGQIKDDTVFLFNLFVEKGFECLPKINGQYSACIYDFFEKKLILISDRYGTRPVYYTFYNNKFFFSPEVKSLILDNFNKRINYDAISDLFHYGHLFGYKTMFENIYQLPEASYLTFQDGRIRVSKYWNYPYYEEVYYKRKISKKEIENYFEEMQSVITTSLNRQIVKNKDKILISLSGGLDSRWLIALAHKFGIEPLTAFTMGPINSEDQIYAKKVANVLNANHFPFEINPYNVWKDAKHFSYVSDGMSMIDGPIQNYEPLRYFFQKKQITLSSQMCDALFGSTLYYKKIILLRNKKKFNENAINLFVNLFNRFKITNLKSIFLSEIFQKIDDGYTKIPRNYIQNNKHPLYCYYNFLLNEYVRRGTLGGNLVNNLYYETRMPSYDNNLIEFAYRLPIELRKNQFIYRNTFNRMFPKLASIPREGTGLPLNSSELRLKIKTFERKIIKELKKTPVNKIIQKLGLLVNPNYVDYKRWFRNELREDIEDLILDKRTLSRGIFKKSGIKTLLNEHNYTEKDNSKLIWQIINLEYFFRNFMD